MDGSTNTTTITGSESCELTMHANGRENINEVVPPVQHESFSSFLGRAITAVRDRFPEEELDIAFARLTKRPKRRSYANKNDEWNDTIRACVKDLEKSTRVSFLLTLNNSHKPYLLQYYAQQFPFEGPMRQYMLDMAEARIRQNCSTWKYRVTQGLIRHVRELMAADPKFKAATNKRKIVKYLKGKFSLDTFARIFDFVKDWINLGGSSVRVHQWCKTLYVELGSHAKMHVNWLDQPDESRLAKSNFSRAGLTDRISSAAGSTSWAHLVPELEEIVLCEKKAYDRSKKKANEFLKPDDDQDFYVPGESDSDE